MSLVSLPHFFPATALPKSPNPDRSSIICEVALQALKDLVLAFAIIMISAPFTASGAWMAMGAAAFCGVAINAFIRLGLNRLPSVRFLGGAARGAVFYKTAGLHANVLIHESGHYWTANRLFQDRARIQIFPFEGGVTLFSVRTLTSAGQKLGRRRSIFLITLAGPFLAVLAAAVSLIAGLMLRKSRPDAAALLIGFALLVFLEHAKYAYSGFHANPLNVRHDFIRLKTFGIHPLAACAAILAIPIIIFIGYAIRSACQEPSIFMNSSSDKTGIPSF